MQGRKPNFTKSAQARTRAAFLSKLAETGQVKLSAKVAKIDPKTAYNWRKVNKEFSAAWDEAIEVAIGLLEDAGFQRALRARDPSDTLLMFMLKARRPEVYRERSDVQITGDLHIAEGLQEARERARNARA